jgi:preprotein translocase subunit SecF
VLLGVRGLNLGLDFTGGTQIEVTYADPVNLASVREQLVTAGFTEAVVQSYGSARDALIRIGPHLDEKNQLIQRVIAALPGAHVEAMEYIGPKVGQELLNSGILAVIVALLGIMFYVAIRFEYRFAVSSVTALIHDPIVILGIFSLFRIEFDLIALAAVLTIIGYSLNDTIVVFDRIRENFRKMRAGSVLEIVNLSINQTLSRTIMTSGLTLLVVIALLLFGGETLFGFSLALTIGIIVGTYSSIYVAGTLAIAMGLQRIHLLPPQIKKESDELP